MENERFTFIARSLTVEGVQVRASLTIESENGRNSIVASHVERLDGADASDLQFAAVVKMLSALPKKSAAHAA